MLDLDGHIATYVTEKGEEEVPPEIRGQLDPAFVARLQEIAAIDSKPDVAGSIRLLAVELEARPSAREATPTHPDRQMRQKVRVDRHAEHARAVANHLRSLRAALDAYDVAVRAREDFTRRRRATHRQAIKVSWDELATLKQKAFTTKTQRADIERHRKRVTVLLDLLADRPSRSKRSSMPRSVRTAKGQRAVPPQKGPVPTQQGPVSDNYYANPLDSK